MQNEIKLLKHDFLGKIFWNNYEECSIVGNYTKNKSSVVYAQRWKEILKIQLKLYLVISLRRTCVRLTHESGPRNPRIKGEHSLKATVSE